MTDLDLDALEKVALEAGGEHANWHPGCIDNDNPAGCQCAYLFDEGHAGGIATVHIDNGLSIADGGNDAPQKDYARQILRHLATFDPATVLDLIALARKAAQ